MLIEQLAEYELELFGYIIATSQVIVGSLVLSQRFSLIGLIALVPLNFSILSVTLSQGWTGTPYVNAFLLFLNLLALLYEYPSLKILIEADSKPSTPHSIRQFPDLKMPFIQLGIVTVGIILSFTSVKTLMILGNLFYLLFFINLFLQMRFGSLQSLVLACVLCCMLLINNGLFLAELNFPMWALLIGAVGIGFLAFIFSLVWPVKQVQLEA